MCNLDEEKEDNVNSNCSENDQQWQGEGACAEAWWASRGGLSDERNVRGEGGGGQEGVRGLKRAGAGMNEG